MTVTVNLGTRIQAAHGQMVRDVFTEDDMGDPVLAPDGVMRVPLINNTIYRFHVNNIPLPKLWVPETAGPAGGLNIVTLDGSIPAVVFVNGDNTPHVWGRNVGVFAVDGIQLVDVSNFFAGRGTFMYDLVGGDPSSLLVLSQANHTNFKRLGCTVDMPIQSNPQSGDQNCEAGWTIRSNTGFVPTEFIGRSFNGSSLLSDNLGSAVSFIGAVPSVSVTGCSVQLGKAANSFVHIDSGTIQGSYSIVGQNYTGPAASGGQFFRPDEVEAITAQADASIAITSFSDSTTEPGVHTTVNFGSIVDFTRGQVVLIEDEAAYDGVHSIVRVASDQMSFDINVVHSTSDPGTLAMVEHTVASCKYVRDETVTITGTTNYNATVQVLRRTDTTFHTPQSFVVDDSTGTATSVGRDYTSPGVQAVTNGAQENSRVLGEACWNGNVSTTPVQDGAVAGVYVPLVLTGAMLVNSAQRVTLSDPASGEFTFVGESPATLLLEVNIQAVKAAGGTDLYRVHISVNGALPAFGDTGYSSLDLRTAGVGVRTILLRTRTLNPGDTVRPVIIGDGTTTAPAISEGQILLVD
jgi:hypothetical protein